MGHSKRCGWPSWRLDQITEQNATDDMPAGEPTGEPTGVPADVFPDETTGFDSLGPFDEVPSLEQEANPAPAKMGWENETELQAAAFTTLGHSVMDTHRSDVAGHPGASKSVEAQCTRADAVGTVAQSTVAGTVAQSTVAGTVARSTAAGVAAQSMVAQPGIFIQVGGRAPSVGPITQATSASAIARCIAATTMATTWIAPLALRHPGGVDEFLLVIDAF